MCALTECAIRVSGTVGMDVHESDSGAEEKQGYEKGDKQNTGLLTRYPHFAAQYHINHQYTSGHQNRQSRARGRQATVSRFLAPKLAVILASGLLLGRVVNLEPMVLRLEQADTECASSSVGSLIGSRRFR
jgi:hypothetical protein